MDDSIVYSIGFETKQEAVIARAAKARGLDFLALSSPTRLSDASTSVVVVSVSGREGLDDLRSLFTDYSQHWFVVAISPGDRELLYAVNRLHRFFLVFLPLKEEEIVGALGKVQVEMEDRGLTEAVYAGLKSSSHVFSWRTADLRISRCCREIVGVLARAGLFPSTGGFERAVLALEEAMVNSVEHGNLELDSSLRPQAFGEEDRYEERRRERLEDQAYANRQILLRVTVDSDGGRVEIEDEGAGFDTSAVNRMLIDANSGKRERIMDVSGKGLGLIYSAFDEMLYNKKGNRVTLVKRAPRPAGG